MKADVQRDFELSQNLSTAGANSGVRHFLYFRVERDAANVARVLSELGFIVERRIGADDINWLVIARGQLGSTSTSFEATRTFLERLADENGGEYDGWDVEVV